MDSGEIDKYQFIVDDLKREMDDSENFDVVREDVRTKLNDRLAWATGESLTEYIQQNKLTMAAFDELRNFSAELSFVALAKDALANENGNLSVVDLFENPPNPSNVKSLEETYYEAIADFNKAFLIEHLDRFSKTHIVRFLSESIGRRSISREFIDVMKLSPNAPAEIRQSLVGGNWNDVKGSNTARSANSNWYDTAISIEDDVHYQMTIGKDLIKDAQFSAARHIYLNLARIIRESGREFKFLEDRIKIHLDLDCHFLYRRIILCLLADKDTLLAERVLESIGESDQVFAKSIMKMRCSNLIASVSAYDGDLFRKAILELIPESESIGTEMFLVSKIFPDIEI